MRFILVSIFLMNTWALKDRALFSVNGQIYFGQNTNDLLKAYNQSLCLIGKKNYIAKLTGLAPALEQVTIAPESLNAKQKDLIKRVLLLSKSMDLESEYASYPKFGTCKISKELTKKVVQIYNTNYELKKRYQNFLETHKLDNGPYIDEEYKDFVLKNVDSRLFL
ncbi:hypothetical protein ABMA70_00150 [Halobacteriovorax sp. XZX-3]|uniref:hypothetical protein n=2 Tax=unclassified Halobacteriovorax TaxID=2639665 RepID=UPI003710A810